MNQAHRTLALATGCVISLIGAATAGDAPAIGANSGPYETEFVRRFPLVAGAHHVSDWALYTALVDGDIVGYAARIDPAMAPRFEQAVGKGYLTQRLQEDVKHNPALRASFDDHRRRVATMSLYTDGDGVGRQTCQHPVVYINNEFRLVLGQIPRGDQPLAHATVAPGCAQTIEPGFQLTAGRSPRFKCWAAEDLTLCGWRLPDMPVDLKQVIESEYPKAIKVRWRWRGLGAVTRIHQTDYDGHYTPQNTTVALTVPANLELEFVDGGGRIRWAAPAAGWPARSARTP
jgi:hypothetical protein